MLLLLGLCWLIQVCPDIDAAVTKYREASPGFLPVARESIDMDDYLLVLNAGSSSLKFSVYRRAAAHGRVDVRGQIDGTGTSPRFSAVDGAGAPIGDHPVTAATDMSAALDAIDACLRARYGQPRVAGVGHRVVHGGANF